MAEYAIKLDGKTGYSASIVAAITELRGVVDTIEDGGGTPALDFSGVTALDPAAELADVTAKVNEILTILKS